MYSFRLTCSSSETNALSEQLWEAGTIGIHELDQDQQVILIAFFETNKDRPGLLERFGQYTPEWKLEATRDWAGECREAWVPRPIGERLFLAPFWCEDPTPCGRLRIVHNPGLACGTGEHPCTQMALMALEKCVVPGCTVIDAGTGSGILAIAAVLLGAAAAVGLDTDTAALQAVRENCLLNSMAPSIATGSADCLATDCSDVTVANINGTVLLSILDDLRRITRENGFLILTGFPERELRAFQHEFPNATVMAMNEWRCIIARLSSPA